jgi:hypothetical protein
VRKYEKGLKIDLGLICEVAAVAKNPGVEWHGEQEPVSREKGRKCVVLRLTPAKSAELLAWDVSALVPVVFDSFQAAAAGALAGSGGGEAFGRARRRTGGASLT